MSNKTELPKWFFTNGFLLFYYSRNRLQKIDNINHVQKIKSDKTKGYNFIAMRQISIFYGSLINEK